MIKRHVIYCDHCLDSVVEAGSNARERKPATVSHEFYFQYKTPCINCERKIHTCRLFNLAAVQTLEKLNESLIDDKITYGTASHLTIANPPDTNKCAVLPIENIKDKCIYMKISDIKDKVFISKFPNKWECD